MSGAPVSSCRHKKTFQTKPFLRKKLHLGCLSYLILFFHSPFKILSNRYDLLLNVSCKRGTIFIELLSARRLKGSTFVILCPFAAYYLRYAVRSFFTLSRISLTDGKRAGQKVQIKIAVAVQKVKTPLLFVPFFWNPRNKLSTIIPQVNWVILYV